MNPIAAATLGANRTDYFYLRPDFSINQTFLGTTRELGGMFTTVPVAVASREQTQPNTTVPRMDVFGLGLDYAMYHKTVFDNSPSPDSGPWENLGGIFISAPAALAWLNSRIDVFGVGLDRAMYHRALKGKLVSTGWERLGGSFSSQASLVSSGSQLHLFARGTDFTLRHRSFDGNSLIWLPDWQNLGGSISSPPCAVSWGPDRLDVFAIGSDAALWHRWWDGAIWNDWESLGGNFISAPSAVAWGPLRLDVFAVERTLVEGSGAVRHYWYDGDSWAFESLGGIMTSSPTAVSRVATHLEVYAPATNGQVQRRSFNGTDWFPPSGTNLPEWELLEQQMAIPSRYKFSVDNVKAIKVRSLSADTDAAQMSLHVGDWPTESKAQWIGDISSNSESQTNLLVLSPITVELCEGLSFNYLVVNSGGGNSGFIQSAVVQVGSKLAEEGIKAMFSDSEPPIIGSLLEGLGDTLVSALGNILFANCDGPVAGFQTVMLGRDLQINTGANSFAQVTQDHPGIDSPSGCGSNSHYQVLWSITRA